MARGPLISAEERLEIRRRIAPGERPRPIAAALGRPRQTIHHLLRQAGGITPRPVRRR